MSQTSCHKRGKTSKCLQSANRYYFTWILQMTIVYCQANVHCLQRIPAPRSPWLRQDSAGPRHRGRAPAALHQGVPCPQNCNLSSILTFTLQVSAPEIVSGVSGDSEKKLRELFEQAAEAAPCVLFIDEIDCITAKRRVHNILRRKMFEQIF